MPETSDLLTVLRDVGVTTPTAGDTGDEHVRSALQREIAGRRRPRRRVQLPRRTALRWSAVGAAAAVAAGVVVASGAVGGSHASAPRTAAVPGGSHAPAPPTAEVPGTHAQDTAYIVKRVKANIADGSQTGMVIDSFSYAGSHLAADGSIVDVGPKTFDQYYYTAPDGTVYMGDGGANSAVLGPIVDVKRSVTETTINSTNHTYSQTQSIEDYGSGAANARALPVVNLDSSSSTVLRALRSGQVTQLGKTTISGTQAIALSIKNLGFSGTFIVDVDAQTYEPLREVTTVTGNSSPPYISFWLSATPANIAEAKGESIPAGYTKVNSNAGNAGPGNTGTTGTG